MRRICLDQCASSPQFDLRTVKTVTQSRAIGGDLQYIRVPATSPNGDDCYTVLQTYTVISLRYPNELLKGLP